MFYTYALRSQKTGRRYVGSCQDIENRLGRHNRGESLSTKHGIPWTILHLETHCTRAEAMKRERFLKSGKGREFLNSIAC